MSRPAVLMDLFLPLMLVSSFFHFPTASAQQSCVALVATDSNSRPFSLCNSLAVLGSSLHWNYNPATGIANIAYRAPLPGASGWVAWGINPSGRGMVGTQALVAVVNDGKLQVIRTQVSDRQPAMQDQDLTFSVTEPRVIRSSEALTIFATIALPNNRTTLTHTWQSSTILANGVPAGHPITGPNVLSTGTIDFLSGQSSAASNSLLHRKNIHGVLNAVSWGILMPIGVMIARYLRVFESADPAWFYLHITCQVTAYVLGVSGFGLGLKLGADSKGITHTGHRSIGIVLFCGATLQVLALFLRPDKNHKNRYIWNAYHHGVGFLVILLSVINVFKGFNILKPADSKYKMAYTGVYITLWVIAVTLEVITCVVRRRKSRNTSAYQQQQRDNGMYSAGRQTQMI